MERLVVHGMLVELQNGNAYAAGVLYAHVAEELHSFARIRYRLSEEEAHDALSKMFEHIVRSCKTYNPERSNQATGWVWRIFSNAVQDILREKKRRQENERLTVSLDELAEEDTNVDILRPKKERFEETHDPAEDLDERLERTDLLVGDVGDVLLKEMDLCHPERYYLGLETREAVQQALRQVSASDVRTILARWPKRGPKSRELTLAIGRVRQCFSEVYPSE